MSLGLVDVPDLGSGKTVSDIIADHIRNAITLGSLDEGEPIRQDDVAQLFNVSKIPVREALKSLEAEGLVSFQRNKGAFVTRMSQPEIAEIFEVRAVLEAAAIGKSVPMMTEASLARAEEFCDAFARAREPLEMSDFNWKFHLCLYGDAQRPFLLNLIGSVKDRIERYLRMQLTLSDGHETADREHRQILDACRAGDASEAQRLVSEHILGAGTSLLQHLPKR